MEGNRKLDLKNKVWQKSKQFSKVAILILNWNGWKDTIECLESVFRITYPNYQVIVIDNGSTDGSMEKIKAWAEGKHEALTPEPTHPLYHLSHPPVKKPILYIEYNRKEAEASGNPELEKKILNSSQVTNNKSLILIQTGANLGFAGGNNVGIRYALSRGFDYVLLLNNDTVVEERFLEPLIQSFKTSKEIAAGSIIYYYDKPKVINFAGGKINLWKGSTPHIGINQVDNGQFRDMKESDYIAGSSFLIKTEFIKKLGLLNEAYFLYAEEVDYCIRIKKYGFKIILIPESRIWHKISSSVGKEHSTTFLYHSTKSKILFMKKHAKIYHWGSFFFFLERDYVNKLFSV